LTNGRIESVCGVLRTLAVIATFALASDALGSSCAVQTLDDQIGQVDTIVYAVLIQAQIEDEDFERASATFRVHEVLKGTAGNEIVLTTSADLGSVASVRLLVGARYLLFFNSDVMHIAQCGGSAQASEGQADEIRRRIKANSG
jgi:hypothetical protein